MRRQVRSPAVAGEGLTGAWRLVSFEIERSTGGRRQPYGPDPAGILVYGPDGTMSVQIMRRGRPRFSASDPTRGGPDEAETAFRGYLAYAGTYRLNLEERAVMHRLELSWFPNWEGSELKRFFELAGDRLTLRTPPTAYAGGRSVGVLVWERIS